MSKYIGRAQGVVANNTYDKGESDARYEPIDSAYTKAESDARYEPIDTAYTKAESDARYMDINSETLPDQTGSSGQYLTTDGTSASWGIVDQLSTTYTTTGLIYDFSGTITFTRCNATGRFGPSLDQALAAYTSQPNQADWLSDRSLFTVEQGIQYWVVPKDGDYIIETAGAGRAGTYDGRGRIIRCTQSLKAGELLRILVGQQGLQHSTDNRNYGGHGGSACSVYRRVGNTFQHILLCLGGGGAGYSGNEPGSANSVGDGQAPISGAVPEGGRGSVWQFDYGYSDLHYFWTGGGGGGWLQDGCNGGIGGVISKYNNGGCALSTGGLGGYDPGYGQGGFGGGGATGRDSGASGGGGGYYGGHASAWNGNQGNDRSRGGGSYVGLGVTATDVGFRTGHGYVKVTLS